MYDISLAEIYDAIYHFKDYQSEASYLVDAIRERHPRARTLLETACGTGTYLQHLRPHYQVEGTDLSADMLKMAARRLEGVPLHCADMAALDLGRRFDVVCCLFRSIAYVRTPDRLIAATRSMARHLAPDGLLVIEPFFTPESYWVDRVTLNECVRDDLKIAWMYVSEKHEAIGRMLMNFLVGTPRGVKHFTELHEMGLFSRGDFEDAFRSAGLELQYEPDSPGGTGMYFGRRRNPQT